MLWTICPTHSKHDGNFSDYNDHDTDVNEDTNGNEDVKYTMGNRNEEENSPYVWQKEKGDRRD